MQATAKYLMMFLFILPASLAQAQIIFKVTGFSPDYYAQIIFPDSAALDDNQGRVMIYAQNTDAKLISTEPFFGLSVHLDGYKPNAAGIIEIPYSEQAVFAYKDYNFDGKKDFAIVDGRGGCYSMLSYSFYLATDNAFKFSKAFTQMEHHLCNMFEVDYATQTLTYHNAMAGGGRGHYKEFKVINNKPQLVLADDYYIGRPKQPYSERKIWDGHELVDTVGIPAGHIKSYGLLSFHIKNSGKKVVVMAPYSNIGAGRVTVNLLDAKNTVIARYGNEEGERFGYNPKKGILKADNGKYTIYENGSGLGLKVWANGKTIIYKVKSNAKKGSLTDLLPVAHRYKNVHVEPPMQ